MKGYKHHGWSRTPENQCWRDIKQRCLNPKNKAFHHYGGRGITVCERWMDFQNFISDMGARPSDKHSLDRIDNDGHYEPENCRWTTWDVQRRNCRRIVMIGSECLTDAARRAGLNPITVRSRKRAGLPLLVSSKELGKKLSAEDATAIRAKYASMDGRPKQKADQLSSEYGIKKHTVWNIVARRIWKKAA